MTGNSINPGKIQLRAATPADCPTLADLHFRAYYHRFFDETAKSPAGVLYGAPLAQEFPILKDGQSRAYFSAYWEKFAKNMSGTPHEKNYCFVAEAQSQAGTRIIGFIKGDGAPTDSGMSQLMKEFYARKQEILSVEPEKTGELGSLYIDPLLPGKGLGSLLVQRYAGLIRTLGYESMVTRCYAGNDSPVFFARRGGQLAGQCPIPNAYIDGNGQMATIDIPGVWLLWNKEALSEIISAPLRLDPGNRRAILQAIAAPSKP